MDFPFSPLDERSEESGLNQTNHGESAYPDLQG
jgi:hypothetical protein